MALMANNNEGVNNGVEGMEELRTLPEMVTKETVDDWKDSAAEYVRTYLFDNKQFITDGELIMGRGIQRLVCEHINVNSKEKM